MFVAPPHATRNSSEARAPRDVRGQKTPQSHKTHTSLNGPFKGVFNSTHTSHLSRSLQQTIENKQTLEAASVPRHVPTLDNDGDDDGDERMLMMK